jgi:dihydrofolate reductase
MGRVLVQTSISLDGYIAGPDDAMDGVFTFNDADSDPDEPELVDQGMIDGIGAVLCGRRSYEVGRRAARPETSELYGGRWHGPEFVLTHQPPSDEHRSNITFLEGRIGLAVSTALAAAEGKDVIVLGANVVGQCLDADLVDVLTLYQLPIILGEGIRLFEGTRSTPLMFEGTGVAQVGQVVTLGYRRVRPT